MALRLMTDAEAVAYMACAPCIAKWMALHEQCPWATVFQHPDFVTAWFALYFRHVVPVIVVDESGDRALAGLLVLALDEGSRLLTGAGAHQAEYQCWLAPHADDSSFIVKAIRELRARFPRTGIHLRYLPPGIPLQGLGGTIRLHARPLMTIDADAMARQRSKKNHRQNYNRLQRLGAVRCERVITLGVFLDIVDVVCDQYDFRQAAHFWTTPFAADPAKKPFLLELFRRGLLHVTVLKVGMKIAACHIGFLTSHRAVHLSITTYDPVLAMHSPGNLLLAMVGVQLAQEAIPLLDLTPGGDSYKEHFATAHDTVSELRIFGSRGRQLGHAVLTPILQRAKRAAGKAGVRATEVAAMFARVRSLRPRDLRNHRGARPCRLRHTHAAATAITDTMTTAVMPALPVAKNHLPDILRFDGGGVPVRYGDFLRGVMQRFERSHCLYTCVQHGKLAFACWVNVTAPPAPGAATLFDFYAHPLVDDAAGVQYFVTHIVRDLHAHRPGIQVGYEGRVTPRLRAALAACGFVDWP